MSTQADKRRGFFVQVECYVHRHLQVKNRYTILVLETVLLNKKTLAMYPFYHIFDAVEHSDKSRARVAWREVRLTDST